MYELTEGRWTTPRGNAATLTYRRDTNDYNTIQSAIGEDEYHLAGLHLTGFALDIGAHIGSVTIALALDNPELRIAAVEAVPANVELLRRNVERNGIADRVTIIHAAAGDGSQQRIAWGFRGSELATHHAFIGNSNLPADSEHDEALVPGISLADLVGGPIAFAKVDCEGCEYPFLDGPALLLVERIHGEEHYGPLDLPGFEVTYSQNEAPRGFAAVRR